MSLPNKNLCLVLAVLSLGVFCSVSDALPFANPARKGLFPRKGNSKMLAQKESQKLSNEQLHEALHILRNVNHTLKGADHDYGGHRVQAIKSIDQAEHQLRLALHHHKKGAGKGGKGTGTGKAGTGKGGKGNGNGEPEPQALSDAQLAKAAATLTGTAHLLAKADHDYGGHREKAVKDIHVAVGDLHKALQYSKKNDQNKQ